MALIGGPAKLFIFSLIYDFQLWFGGFSVRFFDTDCDCVHALAFDCAFISLTLNDMNRNDCRLNTGYFEYLVRAHYLQQSAQMQWRHLFQLQPNNRIVDVEMIGAK